MNSDLARQWITHWEGISDTTYPDSAGNPTIGIGLNLSTTAARTAIVTLGLDFESVLNGLISLTTDQIDQLFLGSLNIALVTALKLIPIFDQIPENQQIVIVDLAFNMGQPTLTKFTETLESINQQDWPAAAANLQNSEWFCQVGVQPQQRGGADVAVLGGTASPQSVLGIQASSLPESHQLNLPSQLIAPV